MGKEQDVKYKTQEAKAQDNTVAEYSGDREAAQTELTAVLDFYAKIKERCIAKPEGYEERKRRREAEINGLKQALSGLEDETALVQRKRRGAFRDILEDLLAKIQNLEATIEALAEAIKTLKAEIAEMQVQLKRAGEDREKQNKEFQMTVADQRETQKLLTAALGVLQDFYGKKAAFIQKQEPVGPPPP